MESPLEVLSRAATMVQDQSNGDDNKQSSKQLPTTKWKRERRSKLPEYARKTDQKLLADGNNYSSEVRLNVVAKEDDGSLSPSPPVISDIPIDMSLRHHRGQPPSYNQTISNPGYRPNFRTATNGSVESRITAAKNDLPSGISMCDPIIDEHFRRSLGKDYLAVFANNNLAGAEAPPPLPKAPAAAVAAVQKTAGGEERRVNVAKDFMDNAGLSVDDHFAKALGDTWLKIKSEKVVERSVSNGTSSS